jgi:hypothetical protein
MFRKGRPNPRRFRLIEPFDDAAIKAALDRLEEDEGHEKEGKRRLRYLGKRKS